MLAFIPLFFPLLLELLGGFGFWYAQNEIVFGCCFWTHNTFINIQQNIQYRYKMLHDTKLKSYFDFIGTWDHHYGIFEGCGSSIPYDDSATSTGGSKGASTGGCC